MAKADDDRFRLKLQAAALEVEDLGEKLLDVKDQIIELDRSRNGDREAFRALQKGRQQKVYLMRPGGVFLKYISTDASKSLQEEQEHISQQIDSLRQKQKQVVASLADKGVRPEDVSMGVLNAHINLRDKPAS